MIKKPDKEHIRLLFYFHQKKSAADAQNYLWDIWWKC